MQPKPSSSVHINPKFRHIHINPMFFNKSVNAIPLPTPSTNIYINPRFLSDPDILRNSNSGMAINTPTIELSDEEPEQVIAQIYTKNSRKLVRQPALTPTTRPVDASKPPSEKVHLVKIGSRKLVRVNSRTKSLKVAKTIPKVMRKPIQTKYKIVKEQSTYKIDRRSTKTKMISPVKRLSLSRSWSGISECLTPTKVIVSSHKFFRIRENVHKETSLSAKSMVTGKSSVNRKLSFLSINGILYKSTSTKLQKTDPSKGSPGTATKSSTTSSESTPLDSYRTLFVRGERFLLDPSGTKLLRSKCSSDAPVSSSSHIRRIDFGGLTYVKRSNNTYERTDFHKNRFHLNVAKQRSINVLSQNLVKSNVPCPIYRKLGKCSAFDRSKCSKIHDPKLVDICPKFLKGVCDKSICLLSHDITLSKMPTCRFFLQGLCVKNDCPYLHKKVNEKTSICLEFLRGYCEQAQKCPKRHDFLCPEYENKGECNVTRCPYPHPHRRKALAKSKRSTKATSKSTDEPISDPTMTATIQARSTQRYFIDNTDVAGSMETEAAPVLSADGKAKLSRVLNKIEQMKVNYVNLGTDQPPHSPASMEIDDRNGPTTSHGDDETDDNEMGVPLWKRPKLGKLPSFIPIE